MSDVESRLRAAMHAAVELAPATLMDGVRRRHRRHVGRVVAAWVAAITLVAVASPPIAHALRAGPAPVRPSVTGSGPTSGPDPGKTTRTGNTAFPAAAPGTVLSPCAAANPGDVGSSWRTGLRAGPLYFLPGGAARSARGLGGKIARPGLYVVVVVLAGLKPGSTVVVKAAVAGRAFIRFLFGPGDSLNPGTTYTMRSGEAGVTFVACPPGTGYAAAQAVTDYYGGFLISGDRCVPVNVLAPGRKAPFRVSLGACGPA